MVNLSLYDHVVILHDVDRCKKLVEGTKKEKERKKNDERKRGRKEEEEKKRSLHFDWCKYRTSDVLSMEKMRKRRMTFLSLPHSSQRVREHRRDTVDILACPLL